MEVLLRVKRDELVDPGASEVSERPHLCLKVCPAGEGRLLRVVVGARRGAGAEVAAGRKTGKKAIQAGGRRRGKTAAAGEGRRGFRNWAR